MTGYAVAKYGSVGGKTAKLFRPDRMADALSDICEERWPLGRRKAAGKEWGLSDEQARTVCEASASKATLEHIFKHKRGGWPLVLDIFGRMLGEGLDQHLERERRRHAERAEQIGEVVRDFRAALGGGHRDRASDHLRLAGDRGAERGDLGARSASRTRTRD